MRYAYLNENSAIIAFALSSRGAPPNSVECSNNEKEGDIYNPVTQTFSTPETVEPEPVLIRIITRKAFINRFKPYWSEIEALKELSADVRFLFFVLENTTYVDLDDDETIASVAGLKLAIPSLDEVALLINGTEKEKYRGKL